MSGPEQLAMLGRVSAEKGQHETAIEYFEQALAEYREAGNQRGEAHTLFDIAMSYQFLQEKDRAFIFFDKALQLFVAMKEEIYVAETCFHLAQHLHNYGNSDRAIFYMQTAHDVYTRVGRNTVETAYFLDLWQGKEDSSFDRRRAFMAQLLNMLEMEGEEQFRANLTRNGMPETEIDALLTVLRDMRR